MSITSTSGNKKRQLTSPEDLSELGENRLVSESNFDSSITWKMAESKQIANVSSERSSITSVPSITLKENDLKTIAEIPHSSFETNITQMIDNIISGVVDGPPFPPLKRTGC